MVSRSSSSKELRISWYQLLSVVYLSRGTLPKKVGTRALRGTGDLGFLGG